MRIFLIGYMGCGKTTLGKSLAEELGMAFADLDDDFEARYKISIPDFFTRYGEAPFRQIEQKLLHEYIFRDDLVISTGGGTACYCNNMEVMTTHGIVVYITMTPENLAARLSASGRRRPMLKINQDKSLLDHIRSHLSQRETFYRDAHIIYDGTNPETGELAALIRQHALFIP